MEISTQLEKSLNFKDIIGNDINKNWNKITYTINKILSSLQKNEIVVTSNSIIKSQNSFVLTLNERQVIEWQVLINNYTNIYWKDNTTFVGKTNFIKKQNLSFNINKLLETEYSFLTVIIKNITEDEVLYEEMVDFSLKTININTEIPIKKDNEYQIFLENSNYESPLLISSVFLVINGIEVTSPIKYIKSSNVVSDLDENPDVNFNATLKDMWISMEKAQTVQTKYIDIFNNFITFNDDNKYDEVSLASVDSNDAGIAFISDVSGNSGIRKFGSLLNHSHVSFKYWLVASIPTSGSSKSYINKITAFDKNEQPVLTDLSSIVGGSHSGINYPNGSAYTKIPVLSDNMFNKSYGIFLERIIRVYQTNVFIPTPRF